MPIRQPSKATIQAARIMGAEAALAGVSKLSNPFDRFIASTEWEHWTYMHIKVTKDLHRQKIAGKEEAGESQKFNDWP